MKKIFGLLQFVKPYWKESLVALVLLTVVVAMDLAIPRLIQRIIDEGVTPKDTQVVISTSLIMVGITLLGMLFAVGNSILSVVVGERFSRDLRQALFAKIQTFSFGNLDKLQTGNLIVRLTSDVNQVQHLVLISLRIGTRAPLMMVGALVLMVRTSPRLALILLPLLVLTALMLLLFVSRLNPMYMSVMRRLDRLNNVLQENIAGVRVVKAFVRRDYENERFGEANEDFMARSIRVMKIVSFLMPLLMLMINLGIVMVIWAGGLQVISGDLTVGEIVAFTNYLLLTMIPLMILAMITAMLAGAGASAERISEVLENVPEVQENPRALPWSGDGGGRVVFEDVCFSYGDACIEPVLNSLNLVAEPGETVAILGSTGAGKSSLVSLIPRFYDVKEGSVRIDGVDVRELQHDSMLSQIGVVLQESVLFSGTIRDNIRYGRPDASDEEVVAAAKAAQAHEFIMALPEGYDTEVAQRGANLSGGQRQRIAIARALLVQPKILIMDDSTSAVDVETEAKIQDALESLRDGRTSFIVAQRISTVLNADKIVVIDKGQVVAEGNHASLLATSPIYQEIYESQLGNGALSYE